MEGNYAKYTNTVIVLIAGKKIWYELDKRIYLSADKRLFIKFLPLYHFKIYPLFSHEIIFNFTKYSRVFQEPRC